MELLNAFQITYVCAVALFLKFTATIFIQGGKRFSSGSRPPEDENLGPSDAPTQSYGTGIEPVDANARIEDLRWQRITSNDLENIPFALIISFASLQYPGNEIFHSIAIVVFTVSRILHTICYAYALQPWRTLFWFTGLLSVFGILTNGLVGVFNS
jgi:glutathione S-transferase